MAHRFSGHGRAYEGLTRLTSKGPRWTGKIRLVPELLDQPLRWRKPRRVFVNSMSDLFHEAVPFYFVDRVFDVVHRTAGLHTYQILTKRPERMLEYAISSDHRKRALPRHWNAWLGVSVENRDALHRIDTLRHVPAAVRFVSFEPLLEDLGPLDLSGISWAIWGGESGHGARPCDPSWIRSGMHQCQDAGAVVWIKQLGEHVHDGVLCRGRHMGSCGAATWKLSRMLTGKQSDPASWPVEYADLRVQEFPNA
jgi:protein gp37